MLVCGLLGASLKHSFSPEIHKVFGNYEYRLYEKSAEELEDFFRLREFDGINVTIPYKKAVIPFLDDLSDTARRIGSVNTVVKRADGTLFGDNTDYYGFCDMLANAGISVRGKKVLVLGSGGASTAVCCAIADAGGKAVVISRSGENNYDNIHIHSDAQILVNTTPVGMYPENGKSPVDLSRLPGIKCVADIIYNPARTALLLKAESKGLTTAGGLYMLAAQAKRSSELFTGQTLDDVLTEKAVKAVSSKTQNIILIGMPGSGKTTVAREIGRLTGRPVLDADELTEKRINMTIPEFFAAYGEQAFRKTEAEVIKEAGSASGAVISTGGGCVTVEENYASLHQNGVIVWIKRDISHLARANRPLSQGGDLKAMYAARKPLYEKFADAAVENAGTPEETARRIVKEIL